MRNLIEFEQMECPEPLEFLRNYNHFSTWPPKYPILPKYAKITKFPNFCWKSTKKPSKVRKLGSWDDLG